MMALRREDPEIALMAIWCDKLRYIKHSARERILTYAQDRAREEPYVDDNGNEIAPPPPPTMPTLRSQRPLARASVENLGHVLGELTARAWNNAPETEDAHEHHDEAVE